MLSNQNNCLCISGEVFPFTQQQNIQALWPPAVVIAACPSTFWPKYSQPLSHVVLLCHSSFDDFQNKSPSFFCKYETSPDFLSAWM